MDIQKRLIALLAPGAERETVADVRIGLGYCAVKLGNDRAGVASTPGTGARCCTHLPAAGTLAGRPAAELLAMLGDETSALARAVGLATANALLAPREHPGASRTDVLTLLDVRRDDHVLMFGDFAPLMPRLRETGCRVDVIELDPRRGGTVRLGREQETAAACTLAIVTGTTLINATLEGVLARLRRPRAAVLLGPSSPMCLEAFEGTAITHVAGARVRDADAVLRVVSEGGGTMKMKPFLDFETVGSEPRVGPTAELAQGWNR
jgi:uncharacterized protein (DUF4213/DUF364 family)